jgi:hypothetical protein
MDEWNRLRHAVHEAHDFGHLTSDEHEMLMLFIDRVVTDLARASDVLSQEMARTGWAFVPESGLGLVYSLLLKTTGGKPFETSEVRLT